MKTSFSLSGVVLGRTVLFVLLVVLASLLYFAAGRSVSAQGTYYWIVDPPTDGPDNMGETFAPCYDWSNCNFGCNAANVGRSCSNLDCTGTGNGDAAYFYTHTYTCEYEPPACTPDTSCAASTCSTTTCSDGCGGTVTGTQNCAVSCTVANACGVEATGTMVGASCDATPPPAIDACPADPGLQCSGPCSDDGGGDSCVATVGESCNMNACGVAGGTTQCDGSCSGGIPATSDACPADPGLQCSGPCAGGACVPDTSCADTTCSGSFCSDGCGGTVSGTMTGGSCGGGGGGTVSCSPSSQTVPSGNNATLTASLSGGATFSAWVDGVGNVVSSANPWTKSYTSPASYRARANDGGGNSTYSGYCEVNISGGGCSDSGPVSVTASPNRVKSGVPTTITFTVDATNASGNCTLSGSGITTQTFTPTGCSITSATYASTLTLTEQSTYTLACPGGQTAKVIVNIVPKIKEF